MLAIVRDVNERSFGSWGGGVVGPVTRFFRNSGNFAASTEAARGIDADRNSPTYRSNCGIYRLLRRWQRRAIRADRRSHGIRWPIS